MTKEGSEFPAELSASTMRDAAGKPVSFVAITKDTTERKKAEKNIKAYQKRLRALALELTLTEEREKRHLATELHESIGQLLALCRIKLGELATTKKPAESQELLGETEELVEEIIWHTRSLTSKLGPPVLYQLGLEAALQWLTDHMEQEYGIHTKLSLKGKVEPGHEEVRIFLFRAVQELLINISKYAGVDQAKVLISREDDNIRVRVEDAGVGFNPTDLMTSSGKNVGFGLFAISERTKYFGGKFSIHSEPGEGTAVSLTAPVKLGGENLENAR